LPPYLKVVLIGTDIWDLAPHHLQAAFKALDSHGLVLGLARTVIG
jgi:glycosyltransferase A (GT-A) superfamily protein (DUF2064 family)